MIDAAASWLRTAVVAAAFSVFGCQVGSPPPRIVGGGATSIEPLINSWQAAYFAETGVQVDYIGAGSGNGVQQMIRRAILFGCTDSPLNPEQLEAAQSIGGDVVHIPLTITGVTPICHIPGLPAGVAVRFSGDVLARIFLGEITRWNDAALRALNPELSLPDLEIRVISRSEPSGTTAIFAEFLARSAPDLWTRHNMGRGPGSAFGVGLRQKGNPGVAGEVRRNSGAIGYVELSYAAQMRQSVAFGAVRNRDGNFVVARPETILAAAAAAPGVSNDLELGLIDAPGPDSYPICGVDWAVMYKRQRGADGQRLVAFLRWATARDHGQRFAVALGYAPLPNALIGRALAGLNSVTIE